MAFSGYANLEEATTSESAARHYDVVVTNKELADIAVSLEPQHPFLFIMLF
jgi:hypothetical protein